VQHTFTKRKKPLETHSRPARLRQSVRGEISRAAGSGYFPNRDPVYHVTESFRQSFDEIGRRHMAELAGLSPGGFQPSGSQPHAYAEGTDETPDSRFARPSRRDPTVSQQLYQMRSPEYQDAVRRFSETAFNRGIMAGAVMAGAGRMMLISCLKRAVGQPSVREMQRRLFEGGSQTLNIPGHTPDTVVFNRGVADSAVGLVVDTLRDARSIVDDLAELANGKVDMGGGKGSGALLKLYPFLNDTRERGLLAGFKERLGSADDPDELQVLQNAYVQTQALIQKKSQMRNEFMNKLRFISDRAAEALALFETPGFSEDVAREVGTVSEPPEPPEPPENPKDDNAKEYDDASD